MIGPEELEPIIRAVGRDLARETVRELRRLHLTDAEQLRSVSDMAASLPFSRSKVYQWVQQADTNGLAELGAVRRIDGRWYVHAGLFSRWLEGRAE